MSKDYENVRLFTYTNGSIKHFKSPLTVREDQRSQQLLLVRNTLCNFFRPVVRHLGCFLVGRLSRSTGNDLRCCAEKVRKYLRVPKLAGSRTDAQPGACSFPPKSESLQASRWFSLGKGEFTQQSFFDCLSSSSWHSLISLLGHKLLLLVGKYLDSLRFVSVLKWRVRALLANGRTFDQIYVIM